MDESEIVNEIVERRKVVAFERAEDEKKRRVDKIKLLFEQDRLTALKRRREKLEKERTRREILKRAKALGNPFYKHAIEYAKAYPSFDLLSKNPESIRYVPEIWVSIPDYLKETGFSFPEEAVSLHEALETIFGTPRNRNYYSFLKQFERAGSRATSNLREILRKNASTKEEELKKAKFDISEMILPMVEWISTRYGINKSTQKELLSLRQEHAEDLVKLIREFYTITKYSKN
ncbi:MAG: hypothetical protein Q7S06_03305 [Nanoarchaeota archaeon]|nr:hypothetical protein [Nanoarchaeota archaeon]